MYMDWADKNPESAIKTSVTFRLFHMLSQLFTGSTLDLYKGHRALVKRVRCTPQLSRSARSRPVQ